jgi:hypothetical protein
MLVNGQLKNAQLEAFDAKPVNTDGCTGQIIYDGSADGGKVWVHDGDRWNLVTSLPHFSYGPDDLLGLSNANSAIVASAAGTGQVILRYQTEFRNENGGTTDANNQGYIAPYDGFIEVYTQATDIYEDPADNTDRVFELEFLINGLPAQNVLSNRGTGASRNIRWDGDTDDRRFTLATSAILEVSAGDIISVRATIGGNGTFISGIGGAEFRQNIWVPVLEGHYIEAFC